MLSTILVPLDGSPLAEQALPVADGMARALSSTLVLVRSVQAFTFPGVDPRDAQVAALSDAQRYLDSLASRLANSGLTVETGVPYGEAAPAILDEIDIRKADLIVMATHGRSAPGRWLYGSVADEVLRRATVPVVLVPPGIRQTWPKDRAPVVLVPLDGSELAERALGPLIDQIGPLAADVVLLQVVSLPPYGIYGSGAEYIAFDPDAQLIEARRYVAAVAERIGPTVSRLRVRAEIGQPAATICETAVEEKADLICMATHGRGGIARLVLGSVATGVLRQTRVPLLVVRPLATPETAATRPAGAVTAPLAAASAAVTQVPLSIGDLDLLQRGLGELVYKPGGDPDVAPRAQELRERLERIDRTAFSQVVPTHD